MPGKSVGNGTFSKKYYMYPVPSYIGGISWLIYQHELTIIKLIRQIQCAIVSIHCSLVAKTTKTPELTAVIFFK